MYEHVKQGEERYDAQTYGEDLCTIMYILTFIFCMFFCMPMLGGSYPCKQY